MYYSRTVRFFANGLAGGYVISDGPSSFTIERQNVEFVALHINGIAASRPGKSHGPPTPVDAAQFAQDVPILQD